MVLDEPICWLKMTLKIREKFVLGIQSAGYTHPLLFLCIIRYANIICFISVFTFRKSENKMLICKNLYKFITCKFAPNIFAFFSLCLFSLRLSLAKCVKIFQFVCSSCLHSLVKISRHKSLPIFAPIFSLPFVKFSEKFWKSLHLFICANLIYPFIETSSFQQRFGLH